MNLPNKLTVMRVILIPFYVALILIGRDSLSLRIAADAIFIAASVTDFLDGRIARKYNLITTFGKFMDPLADKLLVCSALICLLELDEIPAWIVIIIIAREFIISGMRLVAAEKGIVLAAGWWGKFKTTFQMLMIIVMTVNIGNEILIITGQVLMWIALALTLISMCDYLIKNRSIWTDKEEA